MLLTRFYLLQLIKTLAGFMGGLVLVDFIFRFVDYLELAARSQITRDDVWKLLVLKLGVGTTELAPLAMLLATFTVILGLRRSNEYTAMLAGGFGAMRLLRMTLAIAVFSALSSGLITLYLKPEAETRAYEIRTRSANEADVAGIRPGVFREMQEGGSVFFAKRISPDADFMEQAFVATPRSGGTMVSNAERAYVVHAENGERTAVFEDGVNYRGEPGLADFSVTRFARQTVRLEGAEIHSPRSHEKFARTPALLGRPTPTYVAEFQWRLSLPLAIVLMSMVSFAIAIRTPVQDWHLSLIIAIAVFFTYKNLLGIGRSLIKDESIPAALGLWWVHALVLLPSMMLLYVELRPRPNFERGLKRLIPAPLR